MPEGTEDRNLFDIWHANLLSIEDLVSTFVPTEDFWRLTSPKNHVVCGSRGSGKTALTRMLAHDHLAKLDHPRAKEIIASKGFVGIYLATRVDWVGVLKQKPGVPADVSSRRFQWGLNVGTCSAFLDAAKSCLAEYVPAEDQSARKEFELAQEIAAAWGIGEGASSIHELQVYLRRVREQRWRLFSLEEIGVQQHTPQSEWPGAEFDADPFNPLVDLTAIAGEVLDLPSSCVWAICIDEAEFLDSLHHRVINTYMRVHPRFPHGSFVFKITTLPYCHYTLQTNRNVSLVPGQDFDYLYIDEDPVQWGELKKVNPEEFAEDLVKKRLARMGKLPEDFSLHRLLGDSPLLRPESEFGSDEELLARLEAAGGSPELVERGRRLLREDPKEFSNQVGRKVACALLLREEDARLKGNVPAELYSGLATVVRCSDLHPRRLLHIFRNILQESNILDEWPSSERPGPLIARAVQDRELKKISAFHLSLAQSEGFGGDNLYRVLDSMGRQMADILYGGPLSSDIVSSVSVDNCTVAQWEVIKSGVLLALLSPAVDRECPDPLPVCRGVFHLSYVLAPHFRLCPRKGEERSLSFFSIWREPRIRFGREDRSIPLFEEEKESR